MKIEPSILIWTVICFCAFAFIIDRLLFKPVLKVMDERRNKIDGAKKRAADLEAKAEKERRLKEETALRQKAEAEKKQAEEIARFKEESAKELKDLREQSKKGFENKQRELEAMREENRAVIMSSTEEYISLFTEKLTS